MRYLPAFRNFMSLLSTMHFSNIRFVTIRRLFLVPPVFLVIAVSFWSTYCVWLKPTLHDSFSQDAHCFTCFELRVPKFSGKRSLANIHFPSTTANIKEVFPGENFHKAEDSRVEYASLHQPLPMLVVKQKGVSGDYVAAPFISGRLTIDMSSETANIPSVPSAPGLDVQLRSVLDNAASGATMKTVEEVAFLARFKEILKARLREVSTRDNHMLSAEKQHGGEEKYVENEADRSPVQTRNKHGSSESPGSYTSDVTATGKSYLSAGIDERVSNARGSSAVRSHIVAQNLVRKTTRGGISSRRVGDRSSKFSRRLQIEQRNTSVCSIDILAGLSDDEILGTAEVLRILAGIRSLSPSPFLQTPSNSSLKRTDAESCDGKYIYMYDLPSKFNVDLLEQCDTISPWYSMCEFFLNEGFGRIVSEAEHYREGANVLVPNGSWHETHQYALELVFHARMKAYRCLTKDPDKATLLYVPYYGGLDVLRWHFRDNFTEGTQDQLNLELLEWLGGQTSWKKNGGKDHLFVLGKIGWDFRRSDNGSRWGSKLLLQKPMFPTTKLLIERDPWHVNDIGVPHPTFFHPKSDDEIRAWLSHVSNSERTSLVSFAGMPRPNLNGSIRGNLIEQCLKNSADCELLKCETTVCFRPEFTVNLFLHSHFCMQPPGDSPTRRSVFDSIVAGCIPVLFDPFTAYYQYPWHLPEDPGSFSVYVPSRDIMSGRADVVRILSKISVEQRSLMRRTIIQKIIPGLLYSRPEAKLSKFRDAFDIAIDNLLERVPNLLSGAQNLPVSSCIDASY